MLYYFNIIKISIIYFFTALYLKKIKYRLKLCFILFHIKREKMAKYKRVFLDGHSYYITIITHRRVPILIDNIKILRDSFRESKKYFIYKIDAIVILPDHIHMIITPQNKMDYPKIIQAIKYNFSKRYNDDKNIEQSQSRYKHKMRAIWQKRYYEHTIRNEEDYNNCIEYIRLNPIKHQYIKNEEIWKYSSFK